MLYYTRSFFEKASLVDLKSNIPYLFSDENISLPSTDSEKALLLKLDLKGIRNAADNCFLGELSDVRHHIVFFSNEQTCLQEISGRVAILDEPWGEPCFVPIKKCFLDGNEHIWAGTPLQEELPSLLVSGEIVMAEHFKGFPSSYKIEMTEIINSLIADDEDKSIILQISGDRGINVFSHLTSTYFKPFIETIYDKTVADCNIIKQNGAGVASVDLKFKPDYPPTLDVIDMGGDVLASTGSVCVSKTVFEASFKTIMPDDVYCSSLFYKWTGEYGGIPFEEIIPVEILKIHKNEEDGAYLKINGIDNNSVLKRGGVRKIRCSLYKKGALSKRMKNCSAEILYNLKIKQGDDFFDILPWTKFNKIGCDYFMFLDTSWLLPQEYVFSTKIAYPDNREEKTRGIRFFTVI
jgi:hypothetical protein